VPHSARISARSVPVKDCYRKLDDEKSIVSGCKEPNRNAAGAGALRRVSKKCRLYAKDWKSELRRRLRWRIRCLAIAIEPLSRGLGHAVAQHIAQRRAVGLALLAQFLQPHRIGSQLFHSRHVGLLGCFRWAARGQQ